MSRFAAQIMDLAIADFSPALLPEGGADALRGVAAALAPWRTMYFECRLQGTDPIDISQHFHAVNGGAEALLELARRRAEALDDGAARVWQRIVRLAELWCRDAGLAKEIIEIGLEYDCQPSGRWSAVPALFAGFASGVLSHGDAASAFFATLLGDDCGVWRRAATTIEIARQYGLSDGRIVGVMLSREAQLRCMVGKLVPDRVESFLDRIAWRGRTSLVLDVLSQLPFQGERTWLALDHAPELAPGCGIEVIFGADDGASPERMALLRWLAHHRLVDQARVSALDRWRDAITPLNARSAWPDALIARALTERDDRLLYFRRFVNHFKLNIHAGEIVAAKAYLTLDPVEWRMQAEHQA